MGTKSRKEIPPRRFKRYPLGEGQSLASSLLGGNRRGIYIYRFSDGSWYIGKSVNVVKRHAQHLHEYKHNPKFEGLAIADMWFMEVAPALGDEYLDEQETATIEYADRAGWGLRNELKTGHPHGHEDFVVVLESGESLAFPQDRPVNPKRLLPPSGRLAQEDSPGIARRFKRLRGAEFYDALREAVAEYIRLTVHEAGATAGRLWSVSALPSTGGGGRLFTFSISSLETLYVLGTPENGVAHIYVNCKRPDADSKLFAPLGFFSHHWAWWYRATEDVVRYHFKTIGAFSEALRDERFLNWCWRLNIEMMRKSPTLHTKGFCAGFAKDLLRLDGDL